MKITSIKSIYLSKNELTEAFCDYLLTLDNHKIARHLKENSWVGEWCQSSHEDTFIITVDGEVEERIESPAKKEPQKNKSGRTRALSEKTITRAMNAVSGGEKMSTTAKRVGVSRSTLSRYIKERNENNNLQ